MRLWGVAVLSFRLALAPLSAQEVGGAMSRCDLTGGGTTAVETGVAATLLALGSDVLVGEYTVDLTSAPSNTAEVVLLLEYLDGTRREVARLRGDLEERVSFHNPDKGRLLRRVLLDLPNSAERVGQQEVRYSICYTSFEAA